MVNSHDVHNDSEVDHGPPQGHACRGAVEAHGRARLSGSIGEPHRQQALECQARGSEDGILGWLLAASGEVRVAAGGQGRGSMLAGAVEPLFRARNAGSLRGDHTTQGKSAQVA